MPTLEQLGPRAQYIFQNKEGDEKWFLPERFWEGRSPGVSAMMRVQDEEEFIEPAIRSIADVVDEIVVVLHCCKDGTEKIVWRLKEEFPHIRIFDYPFPALNPNGPGHARFPHNSLCSRSYMYNYALTRTTRSYVLKWDGHNVALSRMVGSMGLMVEGVFPNLRFRGLNIVSLDPRLKGRDLMGEELSLFGVTPWTYYIDGFEMTNFAPNYITEFSGQVGPTQEIRKPAFLHLKWCMKRNQGSRHPQAAPDGTYEGEWPPELEGR